MYSAGWKHSRDRNTTIQNLLLLLCPTSFLSVDAKLPFTTCVRELRDLCTSVKRCLNYAAGSSPSNTACPSAASVDLTTLLTVVLSQLMIAVRSKTSSLHKLRMMGESNDQSTLRFLSLGISKTRVSVGRNDDARLDCVSCKSNQLVQRLDIGSRRLAHFRCSQRHSNAQTMP